MGTSNGSNDRKDDDAVPEGKEHIYTWPVPERAGPGPQDASSVLWAYHSHTDEMTDTNAGLIGFMESNLKDSINGSLYGNLPGLDVRRDEKVRWYVMAAGTETGLHTPQWHGNTALPCLTGRSSAVANGRRKPSSRG